MHSDPDSTAGVLVQPEVRITGWAKSALAGVCGIESGVEQSISGIYIRLSSGDIFCTGDIGLFHCPGIP